MPARPRLPVAISSLVAISLLLAACAPGASPSPGPSTIRLYTSVTQDTIDAVLTSFAAAEPDVEVEVFRAPTGELNARIAAERREGRVRADVIWATDPLSMEQYAVDGLLRAWTPAGAEAIPADFRTATSVGTRILDMLIVVRSDLASPPTDWSDLTDPSLRDAVAIPDPGFAGSAFGVLGYFAEAEDFGMDYYRDLKANGATQVQAIGDVITGVAEGRYSAGMALDKTIRDAVEAGSPIRAVWPEPGAIAMYSPIGTVEGSENVPAAEAFVEHVIGPEGQASIASTGWRPIRDDVDGPPVGGDEVTVDWKTVFERRDALLEEYRSIFGG